MRSLALSLGCLLMSSTIVAQFGPEQIISTNALGAQAVVAADFSLDGLPDVVSVSTLDGKVAYYQNSGGSFLPESVLNTGEGYLWCADAADVTGDGLPEFLTASASTSLATYYANLAGNLSFTPSAVAYGPGARQVIAADIDQSGDMDAVCGFYDQVGWTQNMGGGSFGPLNFIDVGSSIRDLAVADMNGDGLVDILVADEFAATLKMYPNLGGGLIGPAQLISSTSNEVWSIVSGDFDGDGDMDVLEALRFGVVNLYENDGLGNFTLGYSGTVSADIPFASAADIDSDGDLDVIIAGGYSNTISYLLNDGSGVFATSGIITTNAINATGVSIADIDNDGDLDVVSSSANDNKIAWYANEFPILGCTDVLACNYDLIATEDDGSCIYTDACGVCGGSATVAGCTDASACNYDPAADCDDGSCVGVTGIDTDNDGLTDCEELFTYGTDPNDKDSDSDGITDAYEVNSTGTDPNLEDTDADGCSDFDEITYNCPDSELGTCPGDINGDGTVSSADLLSFLGVFGSDCE